MQTRWQSFIETVINTLIGYGAALGSQLLIFPMFDINVPLSTNLYIGLWFTVISVIRGYLVRRYFNGIIKKAIYG